MSVSQRQKQTCRIPACQYDREASQSNGNVLWEKTEGAKHEGYDGQKNCTGLEVCTRPTESAEMPGNWVNQNSVKHIRQEESYARTIQAKVANAHPGERETYSCPCNFAKYKKLLFPLRHNDETHWPGDHLKSGAQADPAQDRY